MEPYAPLLPLFAAAPTATARVQSSGGESIKERPVVLLRLRLGRLDLDLSGLRGLGFIGFRV